MIMKTTEEAATDKQMTFDEYCDLVDIKKYREAFRTFCGKKAEREKTLDEWESLYFQYVY
jgi:hypothetical protein